MFSAEQGVRQFSLARWRRSKGGHKTPSTTVYAIGQRGSEIYRMLCWGFLGVFRVLIGGLSAVAQVDGLLVCQRPTARY